MVKVASYDARRNDVLVEERSALAGVAAAQASDEGHQYLLLSARVLISGVTSYAAHTVGGKHSHLPAGVIVATKGTAGS